MCKSTTDTSVMDCKCNTFGNSKLCQHNQHPSGCPYCKIDRLTAENAKLQQVVAGRTCFHSDEAVNEEVTRLRAEAHISLQGWNDEKEVAADLRRQLTEQSVMINNLTRQVGVLKDFARANMAIARDANERSTKAEAALAAAIEERNKAREETKEAEASRARLCSAVNMGKSWMDALDRAEKSEAALEQARIDSHLAGMEEAAMIVDTRNDFDSPALAIRARIKEIEEKKHGK